MMGLFDEIKKSARDKANELVKSALEAADKSINHNSMEDNQPSAVPKTATNAEHSQQVNKNDKEDVKLNELHNQLQSKLSELKRLECDSHLIKKQEKLQEKLDRVEELEDEFSSLFSDYEDEVQSHIDDLEEVLQDKIDEIDDEEEEDEEEEDEDENEEDVDEEDENGNEVENEEKFEESEDENASVLQRPQPLTAPAPPISSEFAYYAVIENAQRGPYNKIQFKRLVDNDLVSATTMVWKEGMEQWLAAKDVDEMKEFFGGQMAPPQIPSSPMGPPPIPKS